MPRVPGRRGRWWLIAIVVVIVVLLGSLKSLAILYTDSLWFSSVHQHPVWSTLLEVKVGLFASFGAIFFVVLWVNLVICDRLGQSAEAPNPEDELVRRYQQAVRPYSGRIHAALAVVIALIAASGTIGEWQNWILFTHSVPFGVKDPQFHIDDSYFVFRLPFLEFLVNWILISLVVILIVTAIFHYLNGGIRAQRVSPRVRPEVKVHLSVLLALVALAKAAGYYLQRYQLDVSGKGYVNGAGYADVHARLPALELLMFISIFAAAILLYNIRRQGWTLPVLAVGLWAFVALVIGVIYPAVLQAFKVGPAQSTLELPYIQRNITATRDAYNLDQVQTSNFAGNTSISPGAIQANMSTLDNIRLWDPDQSISLPTFQKLQNIHGYYTIQANQSMTVDRYTVNGTKTPAVVGVRQINPQDLPSAGWVNTHLQYTHGEGMVLAPANQVTANGNPVFAIRDVPPSSSAGLPNVTQPDVYFGLNQPGYVVANSKQAELDYQLPNGTDVENHYQGTGGTPIGGFFTRAAFALRLGDFNLLISSLITDKSRIMFVRDVQAMAQKAAPFLNFDADPYASLIDGHIDWILDAYTTTAQYPYSQNASTQQAPPGSGLPQSFNYVRNSVKVVVDAYSGQVTFYAMDNDPVLRAYESAFPKMFTPAAQMPQSLRYHLRYPEDIFAIQAAIYGRYHITSPSNFYNAGDAWSLSPTAGVGSPSNALAVTQTTNAQGQQTSTQTQRMSPLYQVLKIPGESGQSFNISDAYVPASQTTTNQILSAFMMASSEPGEYGKLKVFETPPGGSVIGPAQADSEIQQSTKVSQQITFLDQHGSQVILGNVLMIPVDQSMLYVRPLYVESTGNPQPQLKYVIAVYGGFVGMETSLDASLSDVLGSTVGNNSSSSSTSSSPSSGTQPTTPTGTGSAAQAASLLKQASADYTAAQAALTAGGANALGTYQSDIDAAQALISQAEQILSAGATSPTTTTVPAHTGSTTTTAPGATSSTSRSTTTTAPKSPSSTTSSTRSSVSGASSGISSSSSTSSTTSPGV